RRNGSAPPGMPSKTTFPCSGPSSISTPTRTTIGGSPRRIQPPKRSSKWPMTPGSTWGSTGASPSSGPRGPRGGPGPAEPPLRCLGLHCSLPRRCARMKSPSVVGLEPGVEVEPMPLSEDEQRILQEIEAQFYANDPQLAQQVSETTLYRHASRNIKWAALGFVVGFIVLLTSFA